VLESEKKEIIFIACAASINTRAGHQPHPINRRQDSSPSHSIASDVHANYSVSSSLYSFTLGIL
jgi:hypothetical protein